MTLADEVAQAAPEAVREQGMQKDKPLIIAHREGLHALLQAAHRTGFDHLSFVTAVDWPADKLEEHADEGWLPDFVGAAYGTSEADASEGASADAEAGNEEQGDEASAADDQAAEGGPDEAAGLIELVYNLYSYDKGEHLAVQCWIPRDLGDCWAPSVADIWRGANWHERETYDLYGVTFRDHPNLTRIFMPEEWDGHPGRKDYDLTQEQFIYRRDDGTDGVSKDPGKGW